MRIKDKTPKTFPGSYALRRVLHRRRVGTRKKVKTLSNPFLVLAQNQLGLVDHAVAAVAHAVRIRALECILGAEALFGAATETARRRADRRARTRIAGEGADDRTARRAEQRARARANRGFLGRAAGGLLGELFTFRDVLIDPISVRVVVRVDGRRPAAITVTAGEQGTADDGDA